MPDDFVPPLSGAPLRTRQFFDRVSDQARRTSGKLFRTGPSQSPIDRTVWVRINNAATGGGKYEGYLQNLGAAISSLATDLVDTDTGGDGDQCVIYNWAESQQTTHALTVAENVNLIFPGVIRGSYTDGRPIVWINGIAMRDDCETPT